MKAAFLSTLILALSTSAGFAQQPAQCRNFEATIALQMTKEGCLSQIDLCTVGTVMSNEPALSGATWLFTAQGNYSRKKSRQINGMRPKCPHLYADQRGNYQLWKTSQDAARIAEATDNDRCYPGAVTHVLTRGEMSQREVWVFCDCAGCPHEANISDIDGMNLCAECFIEYSEGKLIDKTKYDEDAEPYMEDEL
jgi:hypothetical protein